MKRETIENILNFLKEKEGKKIPGKWSIVERLETHPDGIQYKHNGHLSLYNRNITKLPKDLYVDGNFYLRNCSQLTKLPDDLHVELDLVLRDCIQLTKLPNYLYVGGYLALNGCKQLTKLPDDLHVTDSLIMIGTNISEVPNNLYVGGNFSIANTPLAEKYTDEEIRKIVASTGGQINGQILK